MNKYWVTKDNEEYMIITEAFDEQAGNYYQTVESGFDNEEDATKVAQLMNKDLQLYLDSEDAMCYHDPSERMKELGYSFIDGEWKRIQ